MKWLKAKWKKLQILAYIAIILSLLHVIILEKTWLIYGIIVGLGFIIRVALLAFIGWLYRPKKEIIAIEHLCFHLNSNVSLDMVESLNDIQFSNNFLVDVETGESVAGLDRKRAYELLCSGVIGCSRLSTN